jgi:hypothetical protein
MNGCRMIITALTPLLVILPSACASPVQVEIDGVRVSASPAGLEVRNHRAATIYAFAVDRHTAALILWAACNEPATCEGIEAGAARLLPAAEIPGWGNTGEVILYWWHLIPAPDGAFQPDSVRSAIIGL